MSESDITEVSEQVEGDWEEWPYPDVVVTSVVSGELADRVRAKLNLCPETPVEIRETRESGGYSEYTQENWSSFVICAAGQEHEFADDYTGKSALSVLLAWLDG